MPQSIVDDDVPYACTQRFNLLVASFTLIVRYLFNNQLSGSIPPELGKCKQLLDL